MQAVILAAGEGKRLRPLTNDIPKPMVQVGGKPILEHTLLSLPKKIKEVILIVGYKAEVIKNYFGSSFRHFNIRYVTQEHPLGTGHAAELARPFLRGGSFLLIYADDFYNPQDILDCVNAGYSTVLVHEVAHPERFGICTIANDGRVIDIIEKPQFSDNNLALVGVHKLHTDIFNIPKSQLPNGEYNLTGQVSDFSKTKPVYAIKARFWHPIGYPEDIEAVEKKLSIKQI